MHAMQSAFTSTSAMPTAVHDEYHGEAVVITPRFSAALDDGALASRATFGWRAVTNKLPRPGGGHLRFTSQRQVAVFAGGTARGVQPGARIARSWDGTLFEIVSAWRDGNRIVCEVVELNGRLH